MPTFSKNRNTGQYDVLGEVGAVHIGAVTVNLKSGATRDVTVCSISSPFVAKFGELKGKQCVFGTVAEAGEPVPVPATAYCGYPCPVSGLPCNSKNGPCHDCQ